MRITSVCIAQLAVFITHLSGMVLSLDLLLEFSIEFVTIDLPNSIKILQNEALELITVVVFRAVDHPLAFCILVHLLETQC